MRLPSRKILVIAIIAFAIIAIGFFVFFKVYKKTPEPVPIVPEVLKLDEPIQKTIGTSVQGRKIESYTYGSGEKHIVFVGGTHGGYEWNTVLLAYQFIDYLDKNKSFVPANLTVTVIPSLNPDGLYRVTGKEGRFAVSDVSISEEVLASGRFNGNNVDLNRNFDCKWQPESTWRSKVVSAGKSVFSEPEAQAIKKFVTDSKPDAFVFWHSQSGFVYASECNNGILPETLTIMNSYAKAAGYKAANTFDAYVITGDSADWLAEVNIPAITVELSTHEATEWGKNLAGIQALVEYFQNK